VTGGVIRHPGDGLPLPSTGAVGVSWVPANAGSSFRGEAGLPTAHYGAEAAGEGVVLASGETQGSSGRRAASMSSLR
jgi:hypothetical protein